MVERRRVATMVKKAFKDALSSARTNSKLTNAQKSSIFVSNLARELKLENDTMFVQETDSEGKKKPGEWMLDIVIAHEKEVSTCSTRSSKIIAKIIWAVESEFSSNIKEVCKDFSKLLYIKSDRYLYISGLNQGTESGRRNYIEKQLKLTKNLVDEHSIDKPFFIAFVPSPAKVKSSRSLWSSYSDEELISWIKVQRLS